MKERILSLTASKKNFDLMLQGIQTEFYCEVNEHFERLLLYDCRELRFKKFDKVNFRLVSPEHSELDFECLGVKLDFGVDFWGAINKERYFVVKLGKRI